MASFALDICELILPRKSFPCNRTCHQNSGDQHNQINWAVLGLVGLMIADELESSACRLGEPRLCELVYFSSVNLCKQ